MPETPGLSDAKRALLEKYLQRNSLAKETPAIVTRHAREVVTQHCKGIVKIQAGIGEQPFFFLYGDWTGKGFFCFPLAKGLGEDQPFYALEPYSFDKDTILPTTEQMAANHLKTIQAIQPRGPYLLGGFCNGGLLAYEMARQLQAQGERVDLLVLMDSIPPRLTLVCTVIKKLGKLLRRGSAAQLAWFLRLQHVYRSLVDRNAEDFAFLEKSDPRIRRLFPPLETLRKEYPAMFIWATAHYVPVFYRGKVTLFWDEAEPERAQWWWRMARGKDDEVEEYTIPGTHEGCKTDHVQDMAARLAACLRDAQDRS